MSKKLNFIVCLFLIFSVNLAIAVQTQIWTTQNFDQFSAGTPKSVSISSKGEVTLSNEITPIAKETGEVFVWCLAKSPDGDLYAGTGNQGKILKIALDGTVDLFYNSPEVSILSLAISDNGDLYAGTAPGGLIYKIAKGENTPTTILNADEKYVWAMTFDPSGNLYAATGTNGRIYKITPDGETSVLFDSDEINFISLIYHDGDLYAGSDGKASIVKIALDGQAYVIVQTGLKEVKTLISKNGDLYAGVITTQPPKPGPRPPGSPTPDGRPPEEKKSAIIRITSDGVASQLWQCPDPLIMSMIVDGDDLIVGTGDEGKIYRVNMDGESIAIAKSKAGQVLAIQSASPEWMIATGNLGKIFRLSQKHVAEGTLKSTPKDTKSISRWGKLDWESEIPNGTVITFATRSGNTQKPDNTWSDWSEALIDQIGSQITSPNARFIQWRATLKTDQPESTPTIKKVNLASIHVNIEPRIDSVQIHAGPPPDQRQNNKPKNPNDKTRSTTWKAFDPNGDRLEFAVYYKQIDESNWKLLKEDLTRPVHAWDSTSMPDGRYQIKITATDRLSNKLDNAFSTSKISYIFEIDNTQPDLTEVVVNKTDGKLQISCIVDDAGSVISSAEYKIDGDDQWHPLFPEDGILDSKREVLLLEITDISDGDHTITIKVSDRAGNSAVIRGNF